MKLAAAAVLVGFSISLADASPLSDDAIAKINQVVAESKDCTGYKWVNQGRAPVGFIKGMAQTYAGAYCALKAAPAESAVAVTAKPIGKATKDALAHYQIKASAAADRLRATYTLLFGLGMRESDGNPTEGRDESDKNPSYGHPTAANTEAGIFQVSFDSIKASPSLIPLLEGYQQQPSSACLLDTFMEKVNDKKKGVVGTGKGAEFQTFMKSCPAASVEYTAVMIRVNRAHFGPLSSKAAEYHGACETMLRKVEALVAPTCP